MANCSGNCASCGGCARELVLAETEIAFLNQLAQIPFLPVARKMGDLNPVYLEEGPEGLYIDRRGRSSSARDPLRLLSQ